MSNRAAEGGGGSVVKKKQPVAGKKKPAAKKTAAKKALAKPAAKAKASSTKAKKASASAATKPIARGRAAPAKKKKEGRRIPIGYHDDGITVLADVDAIERHASEGDSVAPDAARSLTSAMNRRELVAFGTRGGGDSLAILGLGSPFSPAELAENGARSRLSCGLLRTSGRVILTDWARYQASGETGKCDGELRALDPGLYKVTVYRNVGRGLDGSDEPADESQKKRCHLVWLEKAEETETAPPFVNLPGADGWL